MGPGSFSAAGTGTVVAANSDELFFDVIWIGRFTATIIQTTVARTITGGTGRFAGASGTMTATLSTSTLPRPSCLTTPAPRKV